MKPKKILTQLEKIFGESEVEKLVERWGQIKQLDAVAPGLRKFLAAVPGFVSTVDQTYAQNEDRIASAHQSLQVESVDRVEANQKLLNLSLSFEALVNSLGQAFLLFDRSGYCLPAFSKSCEQLLECKPASRLIHEVLRIAESELDTVDEWITQLFKEPIEFEDLARLGPTTFPHSQGLAIALDFKAARAADGRVQYVVLIATDRTSELRAMARVEAAMSYAEMITAAVQTPTLFADFVATARRLFKDLKDLLTLGGLPGPNGATIKRQLHTLKGMVGGFGFASLKRDLHDFESAFDELSGGETAILRLLQDLERMVQEFEEVLARNQPLLSALGSGREARREVELKCLNKFARQLEREASPEVAKAFVHEILAIPAATLFGRYDSVVKKNAEERGKKVGPIQIHSAGVRLVPEGYGELWDTLSHLFQNITEHGIESPVERQARGKDPFGSIEVSFRDDDRHLDFTVRDDGGGVNLTVLRSVVAERGLPEEPDDHRLLQLIFVAGVSTHGKVDSLSGRGIGLDALATVIRQLGGQITVHSHTGRGCEFRIRVPRMDGLPDASDQASPVVKVA